MEIGTLRNLEKLFRLMDVKPVTIEPRVEIQDGPASVFVEVAEQRVVVSTMLGVDPFAADAALRCLLSRWTPACMSGVPLRVFRVDDNLVVTGAMPPGSGAELWYRTVRAQRSLLEACSKEE
ncbi:hypothetical protein [Cupriavidus sp. AU9028]|uniref:hypothetical protein n=1 Tax=Cupriavidus sp. AU9028 TaxID=2871157 RepID=UPI001C947BE4|nr:hypothetical protein [Cupriavidus sp. AU9028]MBY4897875.1 hypothetical protein [Cupriavidus sp. AU9028]